jgi:hypothetical protein
MAKGYRGGDIVFDHEDRKAFGNAGRGLQAAGVFGDGDGFLGGGV